MSVIFKPVSTPAGTSKALYSLISAFNLLCVPQTLSLDNIEMRYRLGTPGAAGLGSDFSAA